MYVPSLAHFTSKNLEAYDAAHQKVLKNRASVLIIHFHITVKLLYILKLNVNIPAYLANFPWHFQSSKKTAQISRHIPHFLPNNFR